MPNFGAKDFLKSRLLARRSNRIAADRLLTEHVGDAVHVSSRDLGRDGEVPAAVHFSHLVGRDHAL